MLLGAVFSDFVIERADKFGGTVKFSTYQQLEEAYAKEEIYPLDLKHGVASHLNNVSFVVIFTLGLAG